MGGKSIFGEYKKNGWQEWNRLLNVRLGDYQTDAKPGVGDPDYHIHIPKSHIGTELEEKPDPEGRTRSFPTYLEWQFFAGLAHPAGFATEQGGALSLRQLLDSQQVRVLSAWRRSSESAARADRGRHSAIIF